MNSRCYNIIIRNNLVLRLITPKLVLKFDKAGKLEHFLLKLRRVTWRSPQNSKKL